MLDVTQKGVLSQEEVELELTYKYCSKTKVTEKEYFTYLGSLMKPIDDIIKITTDFVRTACNDFKNIKEDIEGSHVSNTNTLILNGKEFDPAADGIANIKNIEDLINLFIRNYKFSDDNARFIAKNFNQHGMFASSRNLYANFFSAYANISDDFCHNTWFSDNYKTIEVFYQDKDGNLLFNQYGIDKTHIEDQLDKVFEYAKKTPPPTDLPVDDPLKACVIFHESYKIYLNNKGELHQLSDYKTSRSESFQQRLTDMAKSRNENGCTKFSDYKTNPSKLKPNSNLFSRALSWCGRHPFAAAGIATSVILMGVGVGLCFTGIGSVPGAALTALGFKGLAASVSGTTLAVVGGNIATGAAIGIAGSVLGKAAQLVSEGISEVGKTVRNQFNKKKDETPPNLIPGIVISNKEVTYFKAKNCLNNSSKDLNKKPETGQKKLKNDNPDLCSDTVYSSNFKFFNSTKPNDSHKPSDNNSDYTVIPAARRRGGGG